MFDTLFIDLDDTLYPSESGLWQAIRDRIDDYMIEQLGFTRENVGETRKRFFEQYGTALRGIEMELHVNREDYLAYVHSVPLEKYLAPNPALPEALRRLPGKKFIFTNADSEHAKRVMRLLGVSDFFDGIIDTNITAPYCKPEAHAFARAMEAAKATDPNRCVMIDDLARTTRAARAFGMVSVLAGHPSPGDDADLAFTDWRDLPAMLNQWNRAARRCEG